MSEIEMPFSKEMAAAAFWGKKCCTSRSEKKGEIGDTFVIRLQDHPLDIQRKFRIIDIRCRPLWRIRDGYYRLEGFNSPEAFLETWKALHSGHFYAEKNYYVHFFARVR